MSFKEHRRRPTSVTSRDAFSSQMDQQDKTYIAADGQVLQSSMVKNGSPSKRQIAGSTSQVRFSLPPPSDESEVDQDKEEDEEDEDEDFSDDSFLEDEEWQDCSDEEEDSNEESLQANLVFNLDTKELCRSNSRGRNKAKAPDTVADSMRDMLTDSSERHKLYLKPNSGLNDQVIPVPVELELPPLISPKNKGKPRPRSLVFNGYSYEPFDVKFIKDRRQSSSIFGSSNDIQSSPSRSSISVSPSKITIPDLNKPFSRSPVKALPLDNEKEIENPSPAAKKLNNQLNKGFSFPNRADQSLPPLPHESKHISVPRPMSLPNSSSGLKLFNDEGELPSPTRAPDRFLKQRDQPSQPHRQAAPPQPQFTTAQTMSHRPPQKQYSIPTQKVQQQQSLNMNILKPQRALPQDPKQQSPIKFHHHRNSEYQLEPEVQAIHQEKIRGQPLEEEKQIRQVSDHSITSIQDSIQDSIQESLQGSSPQLQESDETFVPMSIRGSIQRSIQETVESIEEDDVSIISVEQDDTQLLELGNLIIASSSGLNVSAREIQQMDKSLTTIEQHTFSYHEKPLGSYQQEIIYPADNVEAEHVRLVSQASKLEKHKHSPPMSQSSYESEFSEPFSQTSSQFTTATSVASMDETTVDLTNDGYDVTYIKDKSDRVNSFRSVLKKKSNGDLQETIILDDEEEEDDDDDNLKLHLAKLRGSGKPRPKSALGYLEFENSNRPFSNFSFETVASEVQLHYKSGEESFKKANRLSLNKYPRTYIQNKSVLELCDDTMQSTREIMEHLKRQRTILMNEKERLRKEQVKQQEELKKIHSLQVELKAKQRPNSMDDGSSQYFDYANSQSYNFQSFMTTKT